MPKNWTLASKKILKNAFASKKILENACAFEFLKLAVKNTNIAFLTIIDYIGKLFNIESKDTFTHDTHTY